MHSNDATTPLKQDALGRVTLPRAQREVLLDEFERSALPATRFAKAAGINYQTFAWWVQQRRHARGDYADKRKAKSAALQFVEVLPTPAQAKLSPMEVPVTPSRGIEVLLPSGASLRITDASQIALATQLIQALRSPC